VVGAAILWGLANYGVTHPNNPAGGVAILTAFLIGLFVALRGLIRFSRRMADKRRAARAAKRPAVAYCLPVAKRSPTLDQARTMLPPYCRI
jgi:hypothetical protein